MRKDAHTVSGMRASLFIGRWQPLHKGHVALIETVLKRGKPVVIGIRDTVISQENPYSVSERWNMLQRAFKKYGELVKIIPIPDIDEVCYGRNVGYAIREITLDTRTESVSGTEIRKKHKPLHPIVWLTGQTGSGKTTTAQELQKKVGGVILDGDEMRECISIDAGFSAHDRHEHNIRVARLAATLARQSIVIVSVIAPFTATRALIDEMLKPLWVYVTRGETVSDALHPYEIPQTPHVIINSRTASAEQNAALIVSVLNRHSTPTASDST